MAELVWVDLDRESLFMKETKVYSDDIAAIINEVLPGPYCPPPDDDASDSPDDHSDYDRDDNLKDDFDTDLFVYFDDDDYMPDPYDYAKKSGRLNRATRYKSKVNKVEFLADMRGLRKDAKQMYTPRYSVHSAETTHRKARTKPGSTKPLVFKRHKKERPQCRSRNCESCSSRVEWAKPRRQPSSKRCSLCGKHAESAKCPRPAKYCDGGVHQPTLSRRRLERASAKAVSQIQHPTRHEKPHNLGWSNSYIYSPEMVEDSTQKLPLASTPTSTDDSPSKNFLVPPSINQYIPYDDADDLQRLKQLIAQIPVHDGYLLMRPNNPIVPVQNNGNALQQPGLPAGGNLPVVLVKQYSNDDSGYCTAEPESLGNIRRRISGPIDVLQLLEKLHSATKTLTRKLSKRLLQHSTINSAALSDQEQPQVNKPEVKKTRRVKKKLSSFFCVFSRSD